MPGEDEPTQPMRYPERDALEMKQTGITAEQLAERREQERLKRFDQVLHKTMELIYENPERYLPPYAGGQKPRETPAPDRVTSPERQDPELPPKERPPVVVPMVPKEKPSPEKGPELPPAAQKMTPEQIAQKKRELAQLEKDVRALESELGMFHYPEGGPGQMTGKGSPQSKPPERILSEPEREARAQEEAKREAKRIEYDSPERREAIAAHMAKEGVPPELAAIRMLAEVGNAEPPHKAVNRRAAEVAERERRDKGGPEQGQERTR